MKKYKLCSDAKIKANNLCEAQRVIASYFLSLSRGENPQSIFGEGSIVLIQERSENEFTKNSKVGSKGN